jgi:YesN/AraC family two-component response regulator
MITRKLSDEIVAYIISQHPLDFCYISINTIAKHFRISVPQLSRIFKDDHGITLKDFLARVKIMKSKFLLIKNKTLELNEVANILGFYSADHFTQIFERYMGVTPDKFREMNGVYYESENTLERENRGSDA